MSGCAHQIVCDRDVFAGTSDVPELNAKKFDLSGQQIRLLPAFCATSRYKFIVIVSRNHLLGIFFGVCAQ